MSESLLEPADDAHRSVAPDFCMNTFMLLDHDAFTQAIAENKLAERVR